MIKHLLKLTATVGAVLIISGALMISVGQAQTAPPPNLGEETKGVPAIEESAFQSDKAISNDVSAGKTVKKSTSVFGDSTVVESRRESGQVYSIELQHSNAPTQYIEETDSDGDIESTSNDLEETPNLPKWKLGSW